MAEFWNRWKNSRWRPPFVIILLALCVYGSARYLIAGAGYEAKAEAAHENKKFLNVYEARRSGDVITIAGKLLPLSEEDQSHVTDQFAVIGLEENGKKVALSGMRVPLCEGDDVAASGTYKYEPWGGILTISDRRNVARWPKAWPYRLYVTILALYPDWCPPEAFD